MVDVLRFQVGRGQDVVGAVAELAAGSVSVVLRRLFAVHAGRILGLLVAVAQAAIHRGEFFGMRNFLDVAMAGGAFQVGVGRCLEGGRVEGRRHSGLPLAGARTGIVATGAVLVGGCGGLLAGEAGRQGGRDGSDPE